MGEFKKKEEFFMFKNTKSLRISNYYYWYVGRRIYWFLKFYGFDIILMHFLFRHTPSMYPLSPGTGFRSPYPSALPISTSSLPSDFYRFSPTGLMPPHPGLSPHPPHLSSHPAIVTPGPKQELPDLNHRYFTI